MANSIHDIQDGVNRALALLDAHTTVGTEVPAGLTSPCWTWTDQSSAAGYGRVYLDGVRLYMHRTSYEVHNGRIPEGLQIRHACDNPPCVNPDHLLTGTAADNARDRDERGRNGHTSKTHCPQGHPYDEENTRIVNGGRACRACHRAGANSARAARAQGPKTHCKQGHPFDEANTGIRASGRRECLTCKRESARKYREAKAVAL